MEGNVSKAETRNHKKAAKKVDKTPRLGDRVLNVLSDSTDLRDRIYEPALLDLALTLDPSNSVTSPIRDQGSA